MAGFVQSQEGEVLFSGVAPDAQLMMMKVFADGGNSGATESAILNALEDAMTLGADAVNLSLAPTTALPMTTPPSTAFMPGWSRPASS